MRGDRPCVGWRERTVLEFTPHARGSTASGGRQREVHRVYPACAGIDLVHVKLPPIVFSLPRMRGDRPAGIAYVSECLGFTPHARGSTSNTGCIRYLFRVYPACAGIDRSMPTTDQSFDRLPRMRGDRPSTFCVKTGSLKFTPHARGSTRTKRRGRTGVSVYPACAGIDPRFWHLLLQGRSLPRMRGDRPPPAP